MKNVAVSVLLLSSLTRSNSSSDVLNAQGAPASTTSLVAPTIQNTTYPSTKTIPSSIENETDTETKTTTYTSGKFLHATKNTITTQPKGQDSDAGISKEGIFGVIVGASAFVSAVCVAGIALSSWSATTPRTTTPRTTTNTQVDSQEQSADITVDIIDINQEQSATPRSTTSSMTAETIGAVIQI